MLRDLNALDAEPFAGRDYDVCIVGAGFAGISLALALPKHTRVLLLEAGGPVFAAAAQDPYQGRNVGRDYFPLDVCRLRQFGGTSHLWGGWCRQLDAHDFTARAHIDHSGWPITQADIAPFEGRARELLGVAPGSDSQWQGLLSDLGDLESFGFRWSYPVRVMSETYGDALAQQDHIDVVLNANVTDLRLNEGGDRVVGVQVQDYRARSFEVGAAQVVLATGGIEIPRLLLNCNRQIPAGIGNAHDLVGRFFMEHPHFDVGHFILDDEINNRLVEIRGTNPYLPTEFLKPTPAFMAAHRCLNFGLRVIHWGQRRERGFMDRLRRLLSLDNPLEQVEPLLMQRPGVCRAGGLQRVMAEQAQGYERPPSNAPCEVDGLIRIASEQAPNPQSRVRLSAERDAFGLRRVELDWRLQAIDKYTMKTAVLALGERFAQQGIGRVRVVDWLLDDAAPIPGLAEGEEVGGNHHIGTTRMADDARLGVVDANLKVFGVDNLYLCGSSVFPTAGHANPTLTIVQLALRLAEHLNRA